MVQREWRPGLMHAVIFLGFMSLLLRKLQLIAIGYDESATFPDGFGGPFAAFKDVDRTGGRRWRCCTRSTAASSPRPPRLERNREALLVLALILAIMVTDFAFDGFRFALLSERVPGIAHERGFAFVGEAVASCLSRAVAGGAGGRLRAVVLGADGGRVLASSCCCPTGEHFHIVTALAALFFRRGRPGQPRARRRHRQADGGRPTRPT